MRRCRIFWLLLAAVLWLTAVWSANAVFVLAAVGLMLALLVAAGMNRLVPAKVQLWAELPDRVEKNESAAGQIVISNEGALSYRMLCAELDYRNMLTGGSGKMRCCAALPAGGRAVFPITLSDELCGAVEISCSELWLYDFWGLTRRSSRTGFRHKMFVLPEVFPTDIIITPSLSITNDETDAAPLPGPDLSEVFAFREYVPGDSLKQIHWKLTEKRDCLIVREGSRLPDSRVLLFLQTDYNEGTAPQGAAAAALLEALVSVGQSLCESHIPYHIAWQDAAGGGLNEHEIRQEEDLAALLDKLLSIEFGSIEAAAVSDWPAVSRIVYFGTGIGGPEPVAAPEGAELIYVIVSDDAADTGTAGRCITFSPQTLAEDLAFIEI